MAYYYVKNTGSSTTAGGTTKQTGAFSGLAATAVYASIADAVLYGAGDGDACCVSDAHAESTSSIIFEGSITGALTIISVDDANCDTEKDAATAQFTASGDISLKNNLFIKGCYLKSGDDIFASVPTSVLIENGTLETTGSDDRLLSLGADNASVITRNVSYIGAAGSIFYVAYGGRLSVFGGSLSGVTSSFSSGGFVNGGGTLVLSGVDLSSITGTLFSDVGSSRSGDDTIYITVEGCELNASLTGFLNEAFSNYGHSLRISSSASSAALAEYQYWYEAINGHVEDESDALIHRDESQSYTSGTKASLKCSAQSTATEASPFIFDFPTKYAELSTATDKIRIYLASTEALTDLDVNVNVMYPDGTDKHHYNFISTKPVNTLATGTTLTTDSGSTWKDGASDLTGYNEYYIELDTSNDAGADGIPIIQISVSKASSVIYFDTSIGVI